MSAEENTTVVPWPTAMVTTSPMISGVPLFTLKERLVCVISAQGAHQQMTHDQFADTRARELARAFQTLPAPQWSQVIAEKRATIACMPGVKRPAIETAREALEQVESFSGWLEAQIADRTLDLESANSRTQLGKLIRVFASSPAKPADSKGSTPSPQR